jgi:hypothetical protein
MGAVTSTLSATLESSTNKMSALGGSLFGMLGKQVEKVTELSKGLVDDLAGLVDDKPAGPPAANMEAPRSSLQDAA